MEIVRDLRVLKAIGKRFNLEFDKKFKYCLKDESEWIFIYKNKQYELKFFDGCFYPFLILA